MTNTAFIFIFTGNNPIPPEDLTEEERTSDLATFTNGETIDGGIVGSLRKDHGVEVNPATFEITR